MRRVIGLFSFFFFAQFVVAAGVSPIDSLRWRLAKAPADSVRLTLLYQFVEQKTRQIPREVLPIAREGLQLARQIKARSRVIDFLVQLTNLSYETQDFPATLRYAHELVAEGQRRPIQHLAIGRGFTYIGGIAEIENNSTEAIRAYRQTLHWITIAPPSKRRTHQMAFCYASLADSYMSLLSEQKSHPDSLRRQVRWATRQMLLKAQEIAALGDSGSLLGFRGNAWDTQARLAQIEKNYDSTRIYKRRAIETFRRLGAVQHVVARQMELADIEYDAGRYAIAAALADTVQRTGHELAMPSFEADAFALMARAYEHLGKATEGLRALNQAFALRDTVYGQEKREEIARLQVQFESERQQAHIRALTQQAGYEAKLAQRRQNQLWLTLMILFVVLTGSVIGVGLYVRLRRSREALSTMIESKDRLYALVAHDLRSPMHALAGVSGMISAYARRGDLQGIAELPPLVAQAVNQVTQLLDNLLHWAASQTGKDLAFMPEAIPVDLLLAECQALYEPLANQSGVTLHIQSPSNPLIVWADSSMVRAVLRNLVSNAVKFTPSGGEVHIRAEAAMGNGVKLLVADEGPGISTAEVSQLLSAEAESSARPRRRGARGEGGTGLGLRLCRAFVERHGGKLAFEGNKPRGTLASVWLPGQR